MTSSFEGQPSKKKVFFQTQTQSFGVEAPDLDVFTPPKTNMTPENQRLEDVFPTEIVLLLGTC